MAAALISNKPEFVKLFLEQGVRLKEFVTWDTLVYLYDNMAPSCLFHSKLQKVLLEEKERTAGSKMPRIQLHHVSQVLRELLGCSTQPLYPKPKHTERPRLSIPVPHIKLNVRIQVTWWQGCMREGDTGSRNHPGGCSWVTVLLPAQESHLKSLKALPKPSASLLRCNSHPPAPTASRGGQDPMGGCAGPDRP